ncbi:hypothetical protein AXG93_4316s1130 [Marchantia polymorpha subsp. ruderalis]|uniref:Uncharacterized protein n=1 Tax=Marchantia polymorpha subsp. ruderalis TaxID=1480154 RepID=A0A176VTB8_MARPO|nr:hypothetical protein AXG93_4316s1130 [Marchantia polymorpha subsp. ruderalis]
MLQQWQWQQPHSHHRQPRREKRKVEDEVVVRHCAEAEGGRKRPQSVRYGHSRREPQQQQQQHGMGWVLQQLLLQEVFNVKGSREQADSQDYENKRARSINRAAGGAAGKR